MASVAAYLQRRGGIYSLRVRVPVDLVPLLRRREVVRTLATASPVLARERGARLRVRVLDAWEKLRQMAVDGVDHRDEMIARLEEMLEDTNTTAALNLEMVQMKAHLVERRSLVAQLDYETETTRRLSHANQRLEAVRVQIDVLERSGKLDRGSVGALHSLLTDMGVTMASRPTPTVVAFLEEVFISERRLEADTQRHVENYIRLFASVTGNKQLSTYKRTDITAWVKVLEQLKPSYARGKTIGDKPVEQLLQESKGHTGLSKTTIEKHLTHLKGFFRVAAKHHRFAASDDINDLFNDVRLGKSVPMPRPRKSWTILQLNALFASPTWSGTRSRLEDVSRRHEPGPWVHQDAYWWLPVAALWMGTRLEELAQLFHEDLQRDREGIPYLRIHNEGERRVKNDNSIRNVPVHPFLIELGFLGLFKKASKSRVFPELRPHGRPPKLGGLYSTHFTDYRRAVGVYEPLRDFHSFRRTFITTMRHKAKVDLFTVAIIAGHGADDPEYIRVQQTDDYTDYSIADLRDAMASLDYEKLGLGVGMLRRVATSCGSRGSMRLDGLKAEAPSPVRLARVKASVVKTRKSGLAISG